MFKNFKVEEDVCVQDLRDFQTTGYYLKINVSLINIFH